MKTKFYLAFIFSIVYFFSQAQTVKILNELENKKQNSNPLGSKPTSTDPAGKFDMTAHNDSLQQLLEKTEELTLMALKVRNDAYSKPEAVKKILISEAVNLDQQAQLTQIAASNLSSRINIYKFNSNKTAIKGYVIKAGEENVPLYTKNLIFDSEKLMRFAKEMREEANAQPNLAAKLGNMGNADEQETLAINKQVEALTTLEKLSQAVLSARK